MHTDIDLTEADTASGPQRVATEASRFPAIEGGPSRVRKRYRQLAIGLAASDVLCVAAALSIGYLITFGTLPTQISYLVLTVAACAAAVPIFHAFHLYAPQQLSPSEEFRRIISATSVGVLLLVLMSYSWDQRFPRGWVALVFISAVVIELGSRRLWHRLLWRLRKAGDMSLRTLIVGDNREASRVAEALKQPGLGYQPLGYVSLSPGVGPPDGLPMVGLFHDLEHLIRRGAVDCIFVASSEVESDHMWRISQAARRTGAEVKLAANVSQILTSRVNLQPVGDIMALSVRPLQLTRAQTAIKRGFDICAASFFLILCLPVLSAIAAAIRLTSPGPVVFQQDRVSRGGRTFKMLKFRTMVTDGDAVLREHSIDPSAPFFKLGEDDPRLTRIGRLIRPLSLDELPQLWNVIRGDMSLVGPRPLPAAQVAANLELLAPRHEVSAGVTGWWQIHGRSDLNPEQAVRLDLFYIENWSLSLDLFVLLKTVGAILARRGAY